MNDEPENRWSRIMRIREEFKKIPLTEFKTFGELSLAMQFSSALAGDQHLEEAERLLKKLQGPSDTL